MIRLHFKNSDKILTCDSYRYNQERKVLWIKHKDSEREHKYFRVDLDYAEFIDEVEEWK